MHALRSKIYKRHVTLGDLQIAAISFVSVLALGAAALFAGPALASIFSGHPNGPVVKQAYVVEGDALDNRANGERFLVANAEAPHVGAKCAAENKLAERARSAARRLVYGARKVSVRRVDGGDPSGRVRAYVSVDGRDLGEALLQSGYARPRREAPAPWCDARGRLLPMR